MNKFSGLHLLHYTGTIEDIKEDNYFSIDNSYRYVNDQ